jgi:hypothetical protein
MAEDLVKPKRGIVLLGIVTILLWASYISHLIPMPFTLQPTIKRIARNIADAPESTKEKAGFGGKTQPEIERMMMRKAIKIWFIKAIPILIGLFSGLFLVRRKNYGRIMAILVAISWISLNFISYVRAPNIRDQLYATYVTSLKQTPLFVIHNDILPAMVFLFTIFYLMRPSIGREFTLPQ